MKKYLPLILLGIVIIAVVGIIFLVFGKDRGTQTSDEGGTVEISFNQRPIVSLTPSSDGHWLTLKIERLDIPKAESLDYELLYTLPDERVQGVPGTVSLKGITKIEKKLLLGSESSGKFRYDEGVKEGSLTIRLRDSKGKLITKYQTKFNLQSGVREITSVDDKFAYTLEKLPKGVFFVTLETFGVADKSITEVTSGPYGVFTSETTLPKGSASGWEQITPGVFIKK